MRVGIIGMGNMGSKYAAMIVNGQVKGMELVAATRVSQNAGHISGDQSVFCKN